MSAGYVREGGSYELCMSFTGSVTGGSTEHEEFQGDS